MFLFSRIVKGFSTVPKHPHTGGIVCTALCFTLLLSTNGQVKAHALELQSKASEYAFMCLNSDRFLGGQKAYVGCSPSQLR
jgi:hypothetical protein